MTRFRLSHGEGSMASSVFSELQLMGSSSDLTQSSFAKRHPAAWGVLDFDFDFEIQKRKVLDLVRRIGQLELGAVTQDSCHATQRVIMGLPMDRALPKVAPDGEGGLALIWDDEDSKLVFDIDGFALHIIERAGSTTSVHHSKVRILSDGELPSKYVNLIPPR